MQQRQGDARLGHGSEQRIPRRTGRRGTPLCGPPSQGRAEPVQAVQGAGVALCQQVVQPFAGLPRGRVGRRNVQDAQQARQRVRGLLVAAVPLQPGDPCHLRGQPLNVRDRAVEHRIGALDDGCFQLGHVDPFDTEPRAWLLVELGDGGTQHLRHGRGERRGGWHRALLHFAHQRQRYVRALR